jgi:VanZ family protein
MTWLRRIFWFGTIAYWIALFVLTHLPPQQAVHIPGTFTDKQVHAVAYLLLSLALGVTLTVSLPGRRWIPMFVVAAAMAYGAIDERTQLFVGRDCELNDWLADVTGACIAAVLLVVIRFFLKPRQLSVGQQLIAGFEGIIPASARGEAR